MYAAKEKHSKPTSRSFRVEERDSTSETISFSSHLDRDSTRFGRIRGADRVFDARPEGDSGARTMAEYLYSGYGGRTLGGVRVTRHLELVPPGTGPREPRRRLWWQVGAGVDVCAATLAALRPIRRGARPLARQPFFGIVPKMEGGASCSCRTARNRNPPRVRQAGVFAETGSPLTFCRLALDDD